MKMRAILLFAALFVLSACGNRGDLMLPSQSPPEDTRRYLIKPKPAAKTEPPAGAHDDDD